MSIQTPQEIGDEIQKRIDESLARKNEASNEKQQSNQFIDILWLQDAKSKEEFGKLEVNNEQKRILEAAKEIGIIFQRSNSRSGWIDIRKNWQALSNVGGKFIGSKNTITELTTYLENNKEILKKETVMKGRTMFSQDSIQVFREYNLIIETKDSTQFCIKQNNKYVSLPSLSIKSSDNGLNNTHLIQSIDYDKNQNILVVVRVDQPKPIKISLTNEKPQDSIQERAKTSEVAISQSSPEKENNIETQNNAKIDALLKKMWYSLRTCLISL